MAISSPGLGSGLDVKGIVSQLMAIEQQPLLRLNQKEARVQAEISAYGSLKGGLSSLQGAMGKLKSPATFSATRASSSDAKVLGASSNTDAAASSYDVTVNRLAQAHKLGSAELASGAIIGGAAGDELTLTVGSDSFTLDLSTGMTLSQIQQAINVETNETGVTAGLISGDSGNQTLVLTSGSSGYDNRVQLSFGGAIDANTLSFSMLNKDQDALPLGSETELDSSLTVDGVAVTRASNQVSDVVSGLTLNLKDTGQATVTIGQDTSVARSAVDNFVKAYNSVRDQLSELKSTSTSSSVLRNIEAQLRSMLNTESTGSGSYAYISQLGVTTNADTGKLEFEPEMLTTAMEDNPAGLAAFFGDANTGFAVRFDAMIEGFVGAGGTIDSIVQGSNDQIGSINRSRDSLEGRLADIEQRYLKQFGALDTLMASMSTTSDYLTGQLDILANLVSGNRK